MTVITIANLAILDRLNGALNLEKRLLQKHQPLFGMHWKY
jgi:hypothetical protein